MLLPACFPAQRLCHRDPCSILTCMETLLALTRLRSGKEGYGPRNHHR